MNCLASLVFLPRFPFPTAGDLNGDGKVGAADVVAFVAGFVETQPVPSSTPGPSPPEETRPAIPEATASPPPDPSESPAPTLPDCTEAGASLEVVLSQLAEEPEGPIFRMHGRLANPTCQSAHLRTSYTASIGTGLSRIRDLAPGEWVHTLIADEPDTGQIQHRRTLLVEGTYPSRLHFFAYPHVRVVRNTEDPGDGSSLRQALQFASEMPAPVLVRFDDEVFPPGLPVTIELPQPLPVVSNSDLLIDALDAEGVPGNRILDARSGPFAVLSIRGSRNHLLGLALRGGGGTNRDALSITGPSAHGNVVEQCQIVGASADGIGIDDRAGSARHLGPNVIRDSEVASALDKGIKVTTGARVRIETSWVHDNGNGGIQATLSGDAVVVDSLVERNGGAGSARHGLAANGSAPDSPEEPSRLISDGNIVRRNEGNGASVRENSVVSIRDTYFAGNGRDGLRADPLAGSPLLAVEGTTFACNGENGVVVDGAASADFGGGPLGSPGANALTRNNLAAGRDNLRNRTFRPLSARNNQWQHCGTGAACLEEAVAAYSLWDKGVTTDFSPAMAHRSGEPPAIREVRPSLVRQGDLIRIVGSGFNAIDGHDSAVCEDLTVRNRCSPLRGNCVRIGGLPASVEAVTPTLLVVRAPFSCVAPTTLTVTTQGGGTSSPMPFCGEIDASPSSFGVAGLRPSVDRRRAAQNPGLDPGEHLVVER